MKDLARPDAGRSHGGEPRPDAVRFCTRCGAVSDDTPQRVCGRCGLGVILTCAPEALGAAFLVVTHDLCVSAASDAAGDLLAQAPDDLLGAPLLDLVEGGDELPRHITRAAMGSQRIVTVQVALRTRDPRTRGSGPARARSRQARVAACGDPPAALVVLD